ncbi:hypothetical protein ARSQ2_02384 [Arsenophonus endosymbiont of Bemisia tabaci Q2]|nr:hypothetical protein ARSQ2_02384 [Arsenophonus endosymbiont of Bemisia tabaci Q2]
MRHRYFVRIQYGVIKIKSLSYRIWTPSGYSWFNDGANGDKLNIGKICCDKNINSIWL